MSDTTSAQLLTHAQSVLSDHGYSTDMVPLGDWTLLLGENHYFIVGVAASPSIADFETLEALAGDYLSNLVGDADVGAKRWDVYLVLLSRELPEDDGEDEAVLFELAHSTRLFRRIVRVGVVPNRTEVESALGAFLPLRLVGSFEKAEDPLTLLENELSLHGVDSATAKRVVAEFRQYESISNV